MFKAELCTLCGDCLIHCVFNKYTREEAIAERQALMNGKWAAILSNCASCHACNETCPQGANPWDLISKLQGVYGVVTTPDIWLERILKVDKARLRVLAGPPQEVAETVLLTCNVEDMTPGVFDSPLYADLTKLMGPAYYCCCPLEFYGNEAGQLARAQGFVDVIARHRPNEVICYHDACYYLLSYRAPEYGITVPFRFLHIFEYLIRTLKQHRDKIHPLNIRIAYQCPCTSRSTPWKEPLLDELLDLIGCERVSRRYDRENALCCGSVLTTRGLIERATEAALRNIEDSSEHSSDALVYLCPGCLKSYKELCSKRKIPLYQISELCQIALGEK